MQFLVFDLCKCNISLYLLTKLKMTWSHHNTTSLLSSHFLWTINQNSKSVSPIMTQNIHKLKKQKTMGFFPYERSYNNSPCFWLYIKALLVRLTERETIVVRSFLIADYKMRSTMLFCRIRNDLQSKWIIYIIYSFKYF